MKAVKSLLYGLFGMALLFAGWLVINSLLPESASSWHQDDPVLFAHRGQRNLHPGNSAAAFSASWNMGFHAVEADIRLTKDQVPILFHDDEGTRLLKLPKIIRQLPWDSIKDQPLHWQGQQTKQEILTLDEFLEILPVNQLVYLDIKEANGTMLDLLTQKLKHHAKGSQFIIASSNFFFLLRVMHHLPNTKTCLEGFNKGKEWLYYVLPKPYHPDLFSSYLSQVDEDHIQFLRDKNLLNRRIVYGVDELNWQDAAQLGLLHLIVDHTSNMPDLEVLHQHLSNKGSAPAGHP